MYRTWADRLSDEIEVCAVQLPGRESRIREPAETSLDTLVEQLVPELQPYVDEPFAFFGHSMGALLAFETARRLRRTIGPEPTHLFVAARRAPQLPAREQPAHGLPEPELVEHLRDLGGTPEEVLQHPELRDLMLPMLRADFAVIETYSYLPEPPLDCPITVFGGEFDSRVSPTELRAWREQTHGGFEMHVLPGDHFFVRSAEEQLLRHLQEEVK
jgi:medium-chain acyl-[acyl-carrier-protein] hydrolase